MCLFSFAEAYSFERWLVRLDMCTCLANAKGGGAKRIFVIGGLFTRFLELKHHQRDERDAQWHAKMAMHRIVDRNMPQARSSYS
jgi:hypothetical protein